MCGCGCGCIYIVLSHPRLPHPRSYDFPPDPRRLIATYNDDNYRHSELLCILDSGSGRGIPKMPVD